MKSDEYRKQIFTALLRDWQPEGKLPDLFERYGLSPEESDPEAIRARVKQVRGFWGTLGNLPDHSIQTLVTLLRRSTADEDLAELLNTVKRPQLAADANLKRKAAAAAQLARLELAVKLIGAKRHITAGEKTALENQFPAAMVAQVLKRTALKIEDRPNLLPKDKILNDRWLQIRNNLRIHSKTLREFLKPGDWDTTSKQQWQENLATAEQTWRTKRPDEFQTAAKELLGVIKSEFVNGDLSAYKAYLRWEQVEPLRQLASLLAAGKKVNGEQLQMLIAEARGRGVPDAEEFVLQLLEEQRVSVVAKEALEFVSCPNCLGSLKGSPAQCGLCGFQLRSSCERCGQQSWSASAMCSSCGFARGDRQRAVRIVRLAREAVAAGRPMRALKLAIKAEEIWKADHDLSFVRSLAQTAISAAQTCFESIAKLRSETRLFEAAKLVHQLRGKADDCRSAAGETLSALTNAIEKDLQRVEADLTRARAAEARGSANEAVAAYEHALAQASDSSEAIAALAHRIPEPSPKAHAQLRGSSVFLHWDPSPAVGDIEYAIVRTAGVTPGPYEERATVTVTRSLTFTDSSVRAGEVFSYAVFVRRHGALSKPVSPARVFVTPEVTNPRAIGGDGFVQLQWSPVPANAKPRVTKKMGSAPLDSNDGRLLPAAGSGLKDTAVENGAEYFYRISLEFTHPQTGSHITPGIVVRGTPLAMPQPVLDLRATADSGRAYLTWTAPPLGSVEILRTSQKPGWAVGANLSAADRATSTRVNGQSPSEARDLATTSQAVWYTPVTIHGDFAIAGEARRFRAIHEVTNLEATDFGDYLQLRWQWPDGCDAVRVLWKADGYPTDPNDPQAERKQLTQSAYNGSMRIDKPRRAPHYFTVFAMVNEDGEPSFSSGISSRAAVRLAPAVDVNYRILFSKPRNGTATLSVSAPKALRLPATQLVAHPRVLPLRSETGTVVTRVPEINLRAGESFRQTFPIPDLQKPFFLRLFFREAGAGETIRLVDPSTAELKIG